MKPQEMIDVIQAHADGKQLQMRPKGDAMWIDCKPPSPMFDFCHYYYRVKPAAPAMWQYFWRIGKCTANDSNDEACQCWFDEGTGPVPHAKRSDRNLTWRPAPATLRPHWQAICKVGQSDAILTDSLYPTIDAAQTHVHGHGGVVIRLATEYPPVMLP